MGERALAYLGSKKRIYPQIAELAPKGKFYIEPFAGGFSLGLKLIQVGYTNEGVINDLDPNVYNFWLQLKNNPFDLCLALDDIHYALLKVTTPDDLDIFNAEIIGFMESDSPVVRAAKFRMQKKFSRGMLFNKLSERAVIKLLCNHSYIKNHFRITDLMLKTSETIKNFEVTNLDYRDLKKYDSPETLWYLDPPYVNTDNARYYASCEDNDFNHAQLSTFVRSLDGDFMKSNLYSDDIKLLYAGFNCHTLYTPSSMNKLGYTKELLITNIDKELECITKNNEDYLDLDADSTDLSYLL